MIDFWVFRDATLKPHQLVGISGKILFSETKTGQPLLIVNLNIIFFFDVWSSFLEKTFNFEWRYKVQFCAWIQQKCLKSFKLKSSNFRKFGFNLALIFLTNQKKIYRIILSIVDIWQQWAISCITTRIIHGDIHRTVYQQFYPEQV